jgi:outer membrane protein
MTLIKPLAGASLLVLASTASAQSATSPWSVHAGPAAVRLSVKAVAESPKGSAIPGGSLAATNGSSPLALDIGYDWNSQWTTRLLVGVPAKSTVSAAGTLSAVGKVGELSYGPAAISTSYSFAVSSHVRPYVGAGVAYLIALKSTDAGVANFNVRNAWGGLLQAGVEVPLSARVGLFLDIKKIYLKTEVNGNVTAFGGAPAYSYARIDPLVIQAGVSFGF